MRRETDGTRWLKPGLHAPSRENLALALLIFVSLSSGVQAQLQTNGFLTIQGQAQFPIGLYHLPEDDATLQKAARAGVNLIQCRNRTDLGRAHALGMKAWISLPLQTDSDRGREDLRQTVLSLRDHPALAVWEGPDEVVWNFTAYSGLFRNGTYSRPDEWWQQTASALKFSETQAARIIPALNINCAVVRELDEDQHPIWINEAAQSDMKFVRGYIDSIQMTGCDIYPIHDKTQKPWVVGEFTDRYVRIGRGRPVWMVLQGFAWSQLDPPRDHTLRYPTFHESRFMAYDAIAHGARGILYWGTQFVPKDARFHESLLALIHELSALQPFLIASDAAGVAATCLDANERNEGPSRGIRAFARRAGPSWLTILVNEDNHFHLGVEVTGLNELNGSRLSLLYGDEHAPVSHGGFVTRLAPFEVKVFANGPGWESNTRSGRDFESE